MKFFYLLHGNKIEICTFCCLIFAAFVKKRIYVSEKHNIELGIWNLLCERFKCG